MVNLLSMDSVEIDIPCTCPKCGGISTAGLVERFWSPLVSDWSLKYPIGGVGIDIDLGCERHCYGCGYRWEVEPDD